MPYIGKSPGQGVRNRFLYTATSGQTTFSGSDDDGRTLTYSDSKFTDVFVNGVLLDPNSDYNATTGTSIVLISGATAGDIVEIISFDTFAVFNGKLDTDVTITGDLTVDTDTLYVDSSSGNVGIGTSSPAFTFGGGLEVQGAGYSTVRVDNSSASVAGELSAYDATFGMLLYTTTAHPISFGTSGGLRMRIDTSGNVLVGGTIYGGEGLSLAKPDSSGVFSIFSGTGTGYHFRFGSVSYGTVGSITTSSTATGYNTSSDYRLKENLTGITDGIERVKQLNPLRFNFIADADRTVDGFLAHEAQEVVPEAVTGTKDAMRDEEYEVTPAVLDDDGNVVTEAVMGTRSVPDYQGIDQSKLIPLLTAALQEAIAKIEALEAKVTALETA